MTVTKRTVVNDDGALEHTLRFEDERIDHDIIVIRHDAQDDQRLYCQAYIDDEQVYTNAFLRRALRFDPISVIGRGETEHLEGVTATDEDVPDGVAVAFNSLGFAPVPDGEWWLNE